MNYIIIKIQIQPLNQKKRKIRFTGFPLFIQSIILFTRNLFNVTSFLKITSFFENPFLFYKLHNFILYYSISDNSCTVFGLTGLLSIEASCFTITMTSHHFPILNPVCLNRPISAKPNFL